MADPTAQSDTGAVSDRQSPPGTPRWVKVFAVIAVLAVVMVAVMLLTGGNHGPGRHSSGNAGAASPDAHVRQSGAVGAHTPPAGDHTRYG